MDETNPYSAPKDVGETRSDLSETPKLKQTTFLNALLRWTPICVVSAAPSFFYGYQVVNGARDGIVAMVVGVVVAATIYAALDIQTFWRRLMSNPTTRISIITVFFVRILSSIIFPVALINDGWCGILCLSLLSGITGQELLISNGIPALLVLVATFLQGIMLSLELLVLGIACVGLLKLWNR